MKCTYPHHTDYLERDRLGSLTHLTLYFTSGHLFPGGELSCSSSKKAKAQCK